MVLIASAIPERTYLQQNWRHMRRYAQALPFIPSCLMDSLHTVGIEMWSIWMIGLVLRLVFSPGKWDKENLAHLLANRERGARRPAGEGGGWWEDGAIISSKIQAKDPRICPYYAEMGLTFFWNSIELCFWVESNFVVFKNKMDPILFSGSLESLIYHVHL